MRNRTGVVAATALAAALALSAGDAGAQNTLRIVMHSDLKILDPIWATAQISRTHGYLVYDTLFALDADLKPQPQMVETWTVDAAGTTYTFTLREGLTWHDGAPVTAEDCVASLKRWGSKDAMGQKLLAYTKELSAPDARTIRLEMKRTYGLVLETLAKPGGTAPFMMPKRVAELPATQQLKEPIGSGPFAFKSDEWRPGARVVYVKNAAYKPRKEPPSGLAGGKVAKVDRIEWPSIPDHQTAVGALQNGEIDAIEAVSHDLLKLFENDKSVVVLRSAMPSQYTMRPNWLHPPFDNPKVREALGYAVDQKAYLEAAVGDPRYYRTCKTYYGCDTPLAGEAGTAGRLQGDSEKARSLLREAGYDGRPIVLFQVSDIASLTNLAPVAKAQLERAGFKVDMQTMDWQTHLARALRKDPPDQRGWNIILSSSGLLDVNNPMVSLWLNSACEKAAAGWSCDKRIEELRDAFALETDATKRKALALELQARAMEVGTHFPLGEWYSTSVVSARTKGWLRPPVASVFWNVEKGP